MTDFNEKLDEILSGLTQEEEPSTETEITEGEDLPEIEDEDAESESEDVDEEEDGEDSDESEEDSEVLTLDPEMTVRIDGKEVKVRDALELKADYTRKTQALAEERKAFEEQVGSVKERLDYLSQVERVWEENPSQLLASFASAVDDAEDLLAETVVALAQSDAADGNLAVVKSLIALAANDLLADDLAEQIGFTDEVIARIKRQAQSDQKLARVERRLAAEDRRRSEQEQRQQTEAQFEAEVQRHLADLNSQWDRITQANPEVASMSDSERSELKMELVKYSQENEGVPLTVAYDALEARRLRESQAKRAASAAAKQKKATGSRVVSKPSTSAGSPAKRVKGDWDSAIAEAVAELEAKKRN